MPSTAGPAPSNLPPGERASWHLQGGWVKGIVGEVRGERHCGKEGRTSLAFEPLFFFFFGKSSWPAWQASEGQYHDLLEPACWRQQGACWPPALSPPPSLLPPPPGYQKINISPINYNPARGGVCGSRPPHALRGAHVCTGGSCAPLSWCTARGHLGTAVGERRHVFAPPVLVHGCGSLQGGQERLQCPSRAPSLREEGLRLSAPWHTAVGRSCSSGSPRPSPGHVGCSAAGGWLKLELIGHLGGNVLEGHGGARYPFESHTVE